MPETSGAAPGHSQDAESHSRSPTRVQGAKNLSHHLLPSKEHIGKKLQLGAELGLQAGTLTEDVNHNSSILPTVPNACFSLAVSKYWHFSYMELKEETQ